MLAHVSYLIDSSGMIQSITTALFNLFE